MDWYRKAADQDNASAQAMLGMAYYKGEGVARDLDEAAKWFRKAAEHGVASAQGLIGACCLLGAGAAENGYEGNRWLSKAADQGDAFAERFKRELFQVEIGGSKEEVAAFKNAIKELVVADGRDGLGFDEALSLAVERRRRAELSRRHEAEEKARREERERIMAEEKRKKDREEADRAAREQRLQEDLAKQEKKFSLMPKLTSGWRHGTVSGSDREYVECEVPSEKDRAGSVFNPVSIRMIQPGVYLLRQGENNGKCACILFGTPEDEGRQLVFRVYRTFLTAALKAKEWRKTAEERGEDSLQKEIPLSDAPVCLSATLSEDGEVMPGIARAAVRFKFVVTKLKPEEVRVRRDRSVGAWFGGLSRDLSHVYCLAFENSDNETIVIDIDLLDEFLKKLNPIGAFEAMEKAKDDYK